MPKKKKTKKKILSTPIYIYAYQAGYSKSSKTLLCQIFLGRNHCLLQGFIVQSAEAKKMRHLGISKNGDYQTSFEISRKLVKEVTGNVVMKGTAEVKLLKTFLQHLS